MSTMRPVIFALYESEGQIRTHCENSQSYEHTAHRVDRTINAKILAFCWESELDTIAKALAKKLNLKYEKK